MEAIDFDDMPDKHLRRWLEHLREDIPTNGFRNVRGLKEGAINTALKRIADLAALRDQNEELKKRVRQLEGALAAVPELMPTNWLDPLLSGPTAVVSRNSDCREIEALLREVQDQQRTFASEALAANSSPRAKEDLDGER